MLTSTAIFVVDDNACTRCSVCVDRCPTDTLYYARLPEGSGGRRTMAEVPDVPGGGGVIAATARGGTR